MSEPATLSSRLIGEIFVERGLVTDQQLEEALVVQQRTGEMIGEVLVSTFGVSRIELASVLAEQWSAMERADGGHRTVRVPTPPVRLVEDPDASDAAARRPLGEIFVERGMATEEQLDQALVVQRESGERLGEVLVRMGVIQRLDLAGALAEQWAGLQKLRPPEPKPVVAWQEAAQQPVVLDAPASGSTDLSPIHEAVSAIQKQLAALASRPDPDLTTLRAETRTLEQRLEAMEGRLDGLAGVDDVAELAAALERISARADEARAQDLAPVLAALAERVDALGEGLTPPVDAQLDERVADALKTLQDVSGRLGELAGRIDELEESPEPTDRDLLTTLEQRVATAVGRSELDSLASGLQERLVQVDEALAAAAAARADVAERPTRDELRTAIQELRSELEEVEAPPTDDQRLAGLAETVDELRSRLEGFEGHAGVAPEELEAVRQRLAAAEIASEEFEALRQRLAAAEIASEEFEALRQRLADLAGRSEVEGMKAQLDEQLTELRSRLESTTRPDDRVASLVEAVADISSRLERSADREALEELATELRAGLGEAPAHTDHASDHDRVTTLIDGVAELRSYVGIIQGRLDASAGRADLAALAAQFGDVRARIEAIATDDRVGPVESAISQLRGELDELRARAEPAAERGELEELTRRLDGFAPKSELQALAQRLDEAVPRDEVAALARRVDEAVPRDEVAALVQRLDGSADRVELNAVRERLEESVGRAEVSALAGDLTAQLDQVRALVESSRVDDRVAPVEAALTELRGWLGAVQGRLDATAVRSEIEDTETRLGQRMEEVAARADLRLAELAARDDQVAHDLHGAEERVTKLVREIGSTAEAVRAELDERLADLVTGERLAHVADELSGRLGGLERRADGALTADALDLVRTELHERLNALDAIAQHAAAQASGASDVAAAIVHERLGDLIGRDELASITGALDARMVAVESSAAEGAFRLEAALDARMVAVESSAAEGASRLEGALDARMVAVESSAAESAFRLETALDARMVAVESSAAEGAFRLEAALDAGLAAAAASSAEASARLTAGLDERIGEVTASSAEASARLAAGLDAIAVELREGIAHLHGRVDELAAGLGHTGGRLAAVEQTAADAAALDELASAVASVRAKVDVEASVSDERARATERAIRKGLASLGERLVAGEQAYLEAGAALRRSLERLGAAVVEADARMVGEPLDSPEVGYVAFVPTADGYRLRPMDGEVPSVGELVELEPDAPALLVARVTVSPLPLDRRPCVYLETT